MNDTTSLGVSEEMDKIFETQYSGDNKKLSDLETDDECELDSDYSFTDLIQNQLNLGSDGDKQNPKVPFKACNRLLFNY